MSNISDEGALEGTEGSLSDLYQELSVMLGDDKTEEQALLSLAECISGLEDKFADELLAESRKFWDEIDSELDAIRLEKEQICNKARAWPVGKIPC